MPAPRRQRKPPPPPRPAEALLAPRLLSLLYNHPRVHTWKTEISSWPDTNDPEDQFLTAGLEHKCVTATSDPLKTLHGCQGNSRSLSKCAYVCKSERESICASWNSFSDACICWQSSCQLTALFHLPILRYNIHPSVPPFLPLFFILLPRCASCPLVSLPFLAQELECEVHSESEPLDG